MRVFSLVVSVCGCFAFPAVGQDAEVADAVTPPAVTSHQATIGGRALRYTVTAQTTVLENDEGEPSAEMFSTAYTLDGVSDPGQRPVMFVFNGGPGSSSVWLHMGTIGPRRVLMSEEGEALPPPGAIQDNQHSWLDLTDLVFIDPVGTGFSKPVGDVEQSEYSGVKQDAQSVAEFIRLYLTNNNRWLSPKFLAGESYGTTRAAALTGVLLDEHNVTLNGVFLISAILDFSTARFTAGNNLPYVLFLPTYTATAWFHQKLPADLLARDLDDVLDEVREWAIGDYFSMLAKGSRLSTAEKREFAERLARYTGLSSEFCLQNHLRVPMNRFVKELRRDDRRTVGRLDSRFMGIDSDAGGDSFDNDPSFSAILGPYTAALQAYMRGELGVERDDKYHILNWNIGPWEWNYEGGSNSFVNVAETLRESITRNPHMLVHVSAGYYDLATPFFAAEYTVDQMLLPDELRDNIEIDYYRGGHMFYIRDLALAEFKEDAARIFQRAMNQRGPAAVISTEGLNR